MNFIDEETKNQIGCVTCPRLHKAHIWWSRNSKHIFLQLVCCIIEFLLWSLQTFFRRLLAYLKCLQSVFTLSHGVHQFPSLCGNVCVRLSKPPYCWFCSGDTEPPCWSHPYKQRGVCSTQCSDYSSGIFKDLLFIFEKEREKECGRDRKSQAASALSAQSPMWGLNPPTVRSWHQLRSRVRHLTDWATQVPLSRLQTRRVVSQRAQTLLRGNNVF